MASLMIIDDLKIIRQRLLAILEGLGHRIIYEATRMIHASTAEAE